MYRCLNCGFEFEEIRFYIYTNYCTSNNKNLGLVCCPKCGSYIVADSPSMKEDGKNHESKGR